MTLSARLRSAAAVSLSAWLCVPGSALAAAMKEVPAGARIDAVSISVPQAAAAVGAELAPPAAALPEAAAALPEAAAATAAGAASAATAASARAAAPEAADQDVDQAAAAAERRFDGAGFERADALHAAEAAKYSAANRSLGLLPPRLPLSLGDYFLHWTRRSKDVQRLGRETILRPTVEFWAAVPSPFQRYWRKMKGVLDFIDRVEKNPPRWATANKVVLETRGIALRDFSASAKAPLDAGKTPVLIVPPNSGHLSTIADYEDGKSIVQTSLGRGRRTLAVDWKSASPDHAQMISDMVQDVVRAIDAAGGKVQLVGLCQGGWVAAIVNALYPDKVEGLYIAGTPLHAKQGENQITQISREMPIEFFNWLVHGIGLENAQDGENQLEGFLSLGPDGGRAKRIDFWTQLYDNIEDPVYVERAERFARWFFHVNHLSLWYLEAIDKIFKGNQLYQGTMQVQVGDRLETVDLSRIKNPIVMFEGTKDDITPPATLAKQDLRGVVADADAAWAFLNREGLVADTGEELVNRKPGELAVVQPKLFSTSYAAFRKLDPQATRALYDLLQTRQGQSFALENVAGTPKGDRYRRTLNVGHIGLYNSGRAQEQWGAALDWMERRLARR